MRRPSSAWSLLYSWVLVNLSEGATLMENKDKGAKPTKKPAAHTLKEKRAAKKNKKAR